MATTIYDQQIKAFWRQMGESIAELDIKTIALGGSTSGTPATAKRWETNDIYDLFWEAGTALQEMMLRMGFETFLKWIPSAVQVEQFALTAGVSPAITSDFVFLYDNATAENAAGDSITCKRIPPNLAHIIPYATGTRWAADVNQSWFDVKRDGLDTKIYVYPGTCSTIDVRGIYAVDRKLSSSDGTDTWNKHFPELLIEGAVAKAKAGTGDFSLAVFFEKLLQAKYGAINQAQNRMYQEQR